MKRAWKATCLAPTTALVLVAFFAVPAEAQSCASEIDRLAQQYNLATGMPQAGSTEPPSGATSGQTSTDRLAQSGGVISPPDTGSRMAIEPPRSNPDRMPTTPPVSPGPSAGATDKGGLSAADRTRMEALLQAARAAERQGKEAQCLDRLRQAEAVPGVPTARPGTPTTK